MNTQKEKTKKKIKAALGKMVEAARELAEAEQAYYGRKPKESRKSKVLEATDGS